MDYTGLLATESIFLILVLLWFAKQLKLFEFFKLINDTKGILPPTITLVVGLFFIPNIVSFCNSSLENKKFFLEVLRSLTPFIAIFTFFLGQFVAKQEKKDQKRGEGYYVLYYLNWLIEGSLKCLQNRLSIAYTDPVEFETLKFNALCQEEIIKIEGKLQEINFNSTLLYIFKYDSLISYFDHVKWVINDVIKLKSSYPGKKVDYIEHSLFKIENCITYIYEKQNLILEDVVKDTSMQERLTSDLIPMRALLINRKKRKEKIDGDREFKSQGIYLNYQSISSLESNLIRRIEKIMFVD